MAEEFLKENSDDNKHSYMMLSRLKSDCDYFLGYGCGSEKSLWAQNKEQHIMEMKNIYNSLETKPDWLSMTDIQNYAEKMADSDEAIPACIDCTTP